FSGHLFQSSGYLSHGLGPTACRVSHQRDIVAHVAEVFRDRDSSIDARLSRGDWHVGSVGDEDCPVHYRLVASRIDQLGKRLQDLRHLVPSLAASYVDDDRRVSPFGKLLLRHRLAGAEGAGDCCSAPFGYGEEEVDYSLPGQERCVAWKFSSEASSGPHRPRVQHEQCDRPVGGRVRPRLTKGPVFSKSIVSGRWIPS